MVLTLKMGYFGTQCIMD